MTKRCVETPVKGGWVKRDVVTGRFVEVRSENGVSRSSARSNESLKKVSARRSAAMKRLADR